MEEGLAQEPVEDVSRTLASVARHTGGYEVGGNILPTVNLGLNMIERKIVGRPTVDTSVVVVSLNGFAPQAFRFGAGHGLEILEKVVRGSNLA